MGRLDVPDHVVARLVDDLGEVEIERLVDQSRDNMVWYVQYAHARAQSVLRRARSEDTVSDLSAAALAAADLSPLVDPSEVALIRLLAGWPRLIESAAEAHEPHRLAFYLYEIAAQFHSLWNKGKDDAGLRFVLADDAKTTLARLALVEAVGFVIASGLGVFGVTPVMELR
jgi:arginyl-tRNA synthetase